MIVQFRWSRALTLHCHTEEDVISSTKMMIESLHYLSQNNRYRFKMLIPIVKLMKHSIHGKPKRNQASVKMETLMFTTSQPLFKQTSKGLCLVTIAKVFYSANLRLLCKAKSTKRKVRQSQLQTQRHTRKLSRLSTCKG